jgi:2-methylcitrate dehydratase PrpD
VKAPQPTGGSQAVSTDYASATAALAGWATQFCAAKPPDDLYGVVHDRLLDYISNVLGGASGLSAAPVARYARRFPGPVPLPDGHSSVAEMAALVFGVAAHTLESDDTHQPSSTHPGAVIFSALLPMAIAADADWGSFVAASVAGYEVMCRIGQATGPAAEYARGFHPTGTVGVFGAAAAASLLLEGDAAAVTAAMGIAGSMSAGSMSFLTDGSWTKHLHPGWAAHAGIIAAVLAGDGYRGPARVLERPHGYFAGHSEDSPSPAAALGVRPFAIERTSTKAHGCCRYEQGALDAILDLRSRHEVTADQVDAVTIGVLAAAWEIIAEPLAAKRRPANRVDTQFSMPFGAAVALLHGQASIHEHNEEAAHDPRLHALMDRVECVIDPSLEEVFPEMWPAQVEIRLRDGRRLAARVDYPKGDPENPFTTDELAARLHDLARDVPEAARTSVIAAIGKLSPGDSMRSLGEALAAAWPTS